MSGKKWAGELLLLGPFYLLKKSIRQGQEDQIFGPLTILL